MSLLDTIAAIATPMGHGGIGIIRISGDQAVPILCALFHPAAPSLSAASLESHRFYYGTIRFPLQDRIVDEVMAVYMKKPKSYTREDVAEIHTHSGPAILRTVLELVTARGARLAEPGEFTRRAFLNGRIDLTQAEAVMDLIQAQTEHARRLAAVHMSGALSQAIRIPRAHLLEILAAAEAAIDFPEDVGDTIQPQSIARRLSADVLSPLSALMDRHRYGHLVRQGIRVAVLGKPNVGKSSLMNRLLQKERVIVTPIPGTTRDAIEETIDIDGMPVVLIDTAGIHPSTDAVERLGIDIAWQHLETADLVLFMTDGSAPIDDRDRAIFQRIQSRPHIWIINKMDIVSSGQNPDIPAGWDGSPCCPVSALTGSGIDNLKQAIVDRCLSESAGRDGYPAPNLRQTQVLEIACRHLQNAIAAIDIRVPFELITMDLRAAMGCLDELLGIAITEDVLDHIFRRFCIGK